MPEEPSVSTWDFDSAINLLKSLSLAKYDAQPLSGDESAGEPDLTENGASLGDFSNLWDYLGRPQEVADDAYKQFLEEQEHDVLESDPAFSKAIRWRDEDGADLEDNIEPADRTAASIRTEKRAARRARARERAEKLATKQAPISDTGTDAESGEELESLRRSPDRKAVIDDILGRKRPAAVENSPPTSPSPPKAQTAPKRSWPISQPFLWTAPGIPSPSHRVFIAPRDGLTSHQRKQALIFKLREKCPEENRFLKNKGLIIPEFTRLNSSNIGVHVFIDISNISIGFHDCLKVSRDIPRDTRVKRIPMNFHNFSLVLERGRPAAKRVLVGSDSNPATDQAKALGYETNILERVHKARELTPRQKKYNSRSAGETSGSETNTGITPRRAEKWVEQAVDEILHLKILESLIDYSDKPSTIVLATGDAAEAEYSGGFLRMVERALEKGWMVELVSFKLNTSSLYRRKEFRSRWGAMFKWIQLDEYAEMLIDEDDD